MAEQLLACAVGLGHSVWEIAMCFALAGASLAALAFTLYTYAGYPLLVGMAGWLSPVRVRRDPAYEPFVSVLIPVHDGGEHLAAKLDSLLRQEYPGHLLEFLVCSDGSEDATNSIAEDYARQDPRIRLLRLAERRGKPSALNRLVKEARGELLLMTDVRQPLAPGAVRALTRTLADSRVGCVSGNLVLRGATGPGAYWHYENTIRRWESRFRSTVGVTGPVYMTRRADMADIPPDIILDDVWVPMRLRLQGRLLLLSDEAEAYDDAFLDRRELGRKVRTLAGNYQLFARMPQLLLPWRNPSWFETVSHKLFRLLCPWALLTLLFATVAGQVVSAGCGPAARAWFGALLAVQAAFYLAALLGARLGPPGRIVRTFTLFNYAAIAGLARFLRGRHDVRW